MSTPHRLRRCAASPQVLVFAAFIVAIGLAGPAASEGVTSLPGDAGWELLVGAGADLPVGFDKDSWGVTALQEWRGELYLGTSAFNSYGCQVWRTTDGTSFTQVSPDGFGNSDTTELPAMIVFQDRLYAGTSNHDYAGGDSGARLWRTADGTSWELVSLPGFGDPYVGHLRSLAVFRGELYVGLGQRAAGPPSYRYSAQIWRSPNGDPGSWELVYEEETSPTQRYVADRLVVFADRLYCLLADPEAWQPPLLRRTADGTVWEVVPDLDLQCWFGGGESAAAAVVGDDLFVASLTPFGGGSLCRSQDGLSWEPVEEIRVTTLAVVAGQLYAGQPTGGVARSHNGLDWEQVGPGEVNGSVHALGEFHGSLFVGSMSWYQGCEVWRRPLPPVSRPILPWPNAGE